jgi:ABC-type sugar transport system ATPase subunit
VRTCTRVLVLRERALVGEIAAPALTPAELMRKMAGGGHA